MSGKELTGERIQRARSLFESVLEVPEQERAGFLAEQCGDDTELLRFVERLLEGHESGDGSFLDPPQVTLTLPLDASFPGPQIGTRIGPYEITDKLGEGGMGTVWKGWDSLLQRSVAIKFVSDRLGTSEQAHQRFLREARSASKLSHQGIATVHGAGEHEGQVYIVFRLIDGETVAERVKRGPLEVADALRLAREAAEALGHAHEAEVLHRDVTSRNLMVDRDGSAVIVDFGLALPESDPRITKTGSTFGTLGYMAPEVVQGKRHDRRSDLYGLGVVLYEMLTGGLPFEAERAESLLYAIANTPVEAPSERRKDLPRDVDRVLLKVLAKDPKVRYRDTAELVADLRRLEAGVAPEADVSPARSGTQLWATRGGARRPWHRRPWVWALAVALAVGSAFLGYKFRPESSAETEPIKLAVLPMQNNSAQPESSNYMSNGLSEALATKLGRVSSLRVTPWITSQNYRPAQLLPLQDIADELGVDQLVVGTFRNVGGDLQVRLSYVDGKSGMQNWAEEFTGSEDELLEISERIATSVATRLRGELAPEESKALAHNPTENEDAYKLYLQGATYLQEGTQASTDLALSFFEKAVTLDPKLAEAHVGIGAVHTSRLYRGWGRGYRSLELAEASYRTALVLDPQMWRAHRGLSQVAWYKGRSEECLQISKLAGSAGPDNVEAQLAQAEALDEGGLADLAIPILGHVISLDPGDQAAHMFLLYANAMTVNIEAISEEAEEYLRLFGEDAEVYAWLGLANHALGNVDAARAAYARALELFGADVYLEARFWWGLMESEEGKEDKARAIWSSVIEDLELRVESDPGDSRAAATLATFYVLSGETDRAEEIQSRLGSHLPFDTPLQFLRIVTYAHVGRNAEALALLREMVNSGTLFTHQFYFAWKTMAGLKQEPGFQDYLRERDALEQRLRAQYAPSPEES